MKLVRYLALAVGDSAAGAARLRQFTDLISHLDGIGTAYEDAQFHLVTGAGHAVGLDGDGVVVGTLFPRDGTDAIRHLDRDGIDRTRASRGVYLTERCWGPYVAFIRNRESGGIDIVRSPLGALPCFLIEIEGGLVLTSDIALPVACGLLSPAVDWRKWYAICWFGILRVLRPASPGSGNFGAGCACRCPRTVGRSKRYGALGALPGTTARSRTAMRQLRW